MKKFFLLFCPVLLMTACIQMAPQPEREFSVEEMPLSTEESGESNLFVAEDGTAYLSWVEYINDTTDALMYSVLEFGVWTDPKEISRGSDWFVNWADFPSIAVNGDRMAVHWLQKSAGGTYDYDVRISVSEDKGKTWGESFILHKDGIPAEHGFVSMLPYGDGFFATWLDGRNTKGDSHDVEADNHGHGHGGAMTLRGTFFKNNDTSNDGVELDSRICECCQTAAYVQENEVLVAYRDRSEEEIRDISIVKYEDGFWTKPQTPNPDNWNMTACPVNGPALAGKGDDVVMAWYTAQAEKPRVQIAFSRNGGQDFFNSLMVDDGRPLGRVDVMMTDYKSAIVSWMEDKGDEAEIRIVEMNSSGKIGESFTVATTSSSRKSGFPVMGKIQDGILVSWTDVDSTGTRVRCSLVRG